MNQSQVSFRNAVVEMEDLTTGKKQREMEIVEIRFPDGKISAFPATDRSPETGERYCDTYSGKYAAFKNGDPDPDRVATLNQEIDERKAELDTMKRPKDDKRVQENLGYGTENRRGQKTGDNTADNGIKDERGQRSAKQADDDKPDRRHK